MRFIGQHHIMNVLSLLMKDLYRNPQQGAAILLDGPSGYGKTTLALQICEYLTEGRRFEYYLYDRKPFLFHKRVIFIDEVHKMKEPEILFPVIDSNEHVIVMATNHTGGLPEALRNRCREFIFGDYDDEDLQLIAMEAASFRTTPQNYMKLVNSSNRNPRILKILVDNFGLYFREHPEENPVTADYNKILEDVFRIFDGMDTQCRRYIEILEKIGGQASLALLSNILHVDQDTLKNQVEPILLRKGLIKISSKGRILV